MNKFKFEAYCQEFPFLQEIIGNKTAKDVTYLAIKRVDENLLARVPDEQYWTGSLGETEAWEMFHFITADGTIIKDAVASKGESGSNYAHTSTRRWEGETILEALSRIEQQQLKYIVEESYYHSQWVGQYDGGDEYNVIIYKLPKDKTIAQAVEEARARAMAMVQAEANF